jgi:iron-sulfur cluster assembly protein
MSIPLTEQAASPITVTEKAAGAVRNIIQQQRDAGAIGAEKVYLRMRIVGGGCSGFQEKLDLDLHVDPKLDEVFEVHDVPVVIDKRSLMYLAGATVDYHDDPFRPHPGFSITNPQAKSRCGCGSSFSM